MIQFLIINGPLPETGVEVDYLIEETMETYYNEIPKYTHKYGDYYDRTVEKIPAYSWELWLKQGEQHQQIENNDDILYIRYRRERGYLATFDTIEELFSYLASKNGIQIDLFKLLDGTPVYGVSDYYD